MSSFDLQMDNPLTFPEVQARIQRIAGILPELKQRMDPCRLCPRQCGAHRLNGELGVCGLDGNLRVASVARHDGEEPPISGENGAINVFFSGCNLHCLHCQNYPISQQRVGKVLTQVELAQRILKKWRWGAQTLGWVTPTPQIVGALTAYCLCLQEGFDLPLVHNNGGYEDPEIIELLKGIVDIWLPDAKTSDVIQGWTVNQVADYPQQNQQAITAMVGLVESSEARAVIVRHLILPGRLQDSHQVLKWLWDSFGDNIQLSLMCQYFPTFKTINHSTLGRKITYEEYEEMKHFAQDLGFDRGWVQHYEEENGLPLHCLR